MSLPSQNSSHEFRKYRKLVAWGALVMVASASIYLMVSVGISINRQRNAVVGEQVSDGFTATEIQSCHEELVDISLALEKHLESAYHLLKGYDSVEARRWAEEGEVWRRQWLVLGARCRLGLIAKSRVQKNIEEMTAAYQELGSIQVTYSKELLRFGNDLAPRLDKLKTYLLQIGSQLSIKTPTIGDSR